MNETLDARNDLQESTTSESAVEVVQRNGIRAKWQTWRAARAQRKKWDPERRVSRVAVVALFGSVALAGCASNQTIGADSVSSGESGITATSEPSGAEAIEQPSVNFITGLEAVAPSTELTERFLRAQEVSTCSLDSSESAVRAAEISAKLQYIYERISTLTAEQIIALTPQVIDRYEQSRLNIEYIPLPENYQQLKDAASIPSGPNLEEYKSALQGMVADYGITINIPDQDDPIRSDRISALMLNSNEQIEALKRALLDTMQVFSSRIPKEQIMTSNISDIYYVNVLISDATDNGKAAAYITVNQNGSYSLAIDAAPGAANVPTPTTHEFWHAWQLNGCAREAQNSGRANDIALKQISNYNFNTNVATKSLQELQDTINWDSRPPLAPTYITPDGRTITTAESLMHGSAVLPEGAEVVALSTNSLGDNNEIMADILTASTDAAGLPVFIKNPENTYQWDVVFLQIGLAWSRLSQDEQNALMDLALVNQFNRSVTDLINSGGLPSETAEQLMGEFNQINYS